MSSGIKRFSGIKKYIDTGSLETGKIKDSVEVTYEDRPSRANMGVKEGDVLSAKMKDTEKIYLVSKEDSNHIYSTGFAVLRIKDNSKLIPKYIYYWLKTENFQKLKNRECTGATQKAIGETKLKKFTIVVPPLEIQKKIVTLLEKVEQAKELRKEADGTYMNFLNSLFLEYFGHPFDNKNINKKMELRDVIEIIVPTRDKPKSFTGNIPWVTLPDLNSSIYIRDAKCRLTKEEAKPTKTRLFPKETVILSCAGSLGKVAIASKEIYTNQQFYGLVCDKSKILPEFLAFQLLLLGEDCIHTCQQNTAECDLDHIL